MFIKALYRLCFAGRRGEWKGRGKRMRETKKGEVGRSKGVKDGLERG